MAVDQIQDLFYTITPISWTGKIPGAPHVTTDVTVRAAVAEDFQGAEVIN